jgi:uncharacterized protein
MSEMMEIASPCISVCIIDDDSGYCKGCWRTASEIGGWRKADTNQRLAILERLKERQTAAGARPRRTTRRRK